MAVTNKNTPKKPAKRPEVHKISSDQQIRDLLEKSLGEKSPLIAALKDNGIIDSLEQVSGKLEKLIQDKNKVTRTDVQLAHISSQIKSTTGIVDELTKNIFSLKSIVNKRNNTNTLKTDNYVGKGYQQILNELQKEHGEHKKSGSNRYAPNALEKSSTDLLAKGFHLSTGLISEYVIDKFLNKKLFKTHNPRAQENLPAYAQSEQHKNYVDTKSQIGTFISWFKTNNKSVIVEKAIKTGDEKIVKSVDAVNDTLKKMSHQFEEQTDIMKNDEEAKKITASQESTSYKFPNKTTKQGEFSFNGNEKDVDKSEGISSGIVRGIEIGVGTAATKVMGNMLKTFAGKLLGRSAAAGGSQLLLGGEVGAAAAGGGVGALIAAAAIPAAIAATSALAGYFIYKDVKKGQELSQALKQKNQLAKDLEQRKLDIKRDKPLTWQIIEAEDDLTRLKKLRKTPENIEKITGETQKIDELKKQRQQIHLQKQTPFTLLPMQPLAGEKSDLGLSTLNKTIDEGNSDIVDVLDDIKELLKIQASAKSNKGMTYINNNEEVPQIGHQVSSTYMQRDAFRTLS